MNHLKKAQRPSSRQRSDRAPSQAKRPSSTFYSLKTPLWVACGPPPPPNLATLATLPKTSSKHQQNHRFSRWPTASTFGPLDPYLGPLGYCPGNRRDCDGAKIPLMRGGGPNRLSKINQHCKPVTCCFLQETRHLLLQFPIAAQRQPHPQKAQRQNKNKNLCGPRCSLWLKPSSPIAPK